MHDEEHILPLVANVWCKTGYNWFKGEENHVNHAVSKNNVNSIEYNDAKAIINSIDFSDNYDGNSGEEDEEENNWTFPFPDMNDNDNIEEDEVEGFA
jgi:hypothetical protein